MSDPDNDALTPEPLSSYAEDQTTSPQATEKADKAPVRDIETRDHLSPEPLSSYEETQPTTQAVSGQTQSSSTGRNAEEPFRKIDLEWQKQHRDRPMPQYDLTPDGMEYAALRQDHNAANERQIAHREGVLASKQDQARDDFNTTAHVHPPFRAADLDVQKEEHDFDRRQIEHREKVIDSLQDKARDDFNVAHGHDGPGLER